ncbi:hypothetical protein NQ317_010205 [Molorchus minor]|uniref:Methyltransferase domain-containing protein n=1 Tax=Molorchus minor TaxID=1323400 RepID=A0ABQ9JAH8_9CUCU|nr:hypothetical protein NQ317_010205 [Molorchus minor]
MNLLPKSKNQFTEVDYWESFFKQRGSKTFEWYGEYAELSDHLHKYIKKQDDVLIIGCGNSTMGQDLYDIGYSKIINIDISQVVIRQMLSQKGKNRDGLKYIQMDALNMTFEDEQFNVILDKGTLDALMPDDSEVTLLKINQYFDEIQRVLKTGGRYICISLLQDHILKAILNYFPNNNWMFRAVRCYEAEKKAVENGENSLPVFIVICIKFTSLPRKVLEINLGSLEKMQRFEKEEDIILHISSVQQAAFVCSGLKRCSLGNENEIVLDLYQPGDTNPRFTVYVVDGPLQRNNSQYAAFIVPQGRETEWLFSTKLGRKHLVEMANHNRLAIVTLHRGQVYDSLETVKTELSNTVRDLAPSSLSNRKVRNIMEQYSFFSLGSDVGNRDVKYQGHSEYSGDYVIEDVEVDADKFRRLFYMNSQLVIQSEAKLKTVKSKKGVSREIVDLLYLTCKHHLYMSMAAYAATKEKDTSSIAVIGLGGGGLCSFLHKFLPKTNIVGVDIDEDMLKIATAWFGFHQDDKLKVEICETFDAVLFDVDSKDSSVGMSCPPKSFLECESLTNVAKVLGLFIINVVLRDELLKPAIINDLKNHFQYIASYKLKEDLNEIFICSNEKIMLESLNEKLVFT